MAREWKYGVIWMACGALGFLLMLWGYDLYRDHRFLHQARLLTEQQAARAPAPAQK
jgi:hypothetical protein